MGNIDSPYAALFAPFQLGHLTLKNRIISTSHAPSYAEGGLPGERYQRYHEEKAKGGLALTMFGGASSVSPDSPPSFGQIQVGDDAIIPYFTAFAKRIHAYDVALMCQLSHAGRRTHATSGNWLPAMAPSPVREPAHPQTAAAHIKEAVILTTSEIKQKLAPGSLDAAHSLNVLGIVAGDRGDLDVQISRWCEESRPREVLGPMRLGATRGCGRSRHLKAP